MNDEELGDCPICSRPLVAGPSVDRHHWVPRAEGGRERALLHKVCHRVIHRIFDEKELARRYATAAAVRAHPEMRRFIAWIKRRPADYLDWPRRPARRRH